jgi:hypothetical protein
LPYCASCLLIDTDRLEDGSSRSNEAITLAESRQLHLVRLRPCLEAVLLRLHPGQERATPVNTAAAERRLVGTWASYNKPPTRQQLARKFQLADLQRAAQVDGELLKLLQIVGLPEQ